MNYETRQKIMSKIERKEKKDVLFLFNGMGCNKSERINNSTEGIIQRVLLTQKRKHLLLILETPGGAENATLGIMRKICNAYETVTVAVFDKAKSAGTIMALCADNILMTRDAQLGPIDGQNDSVIKSVHEANFPLEEVAGILDKKGLLDAEKYNEEALQLGLLEMSLRNAKTHIYPIIERHVGWKKKNSVYKALTSRGNHGSPIFYDEAQSIGLKVKLMGAELEGLIRELVFSAQDELREFEQVGTENILGQYLVSEKRNKSENEIYTNKYSLVESPRKAFVNSADIIVDSEQKLGSKLGTVLVRNGWIEEIAMTKKEEA